MANVTFDEEFDTLGSVLQTQYAWAQNGFATGDMASWLANPSLLPADANTVSVDNGLLTLSDIPKPSDVSSDQIGGLSRIAGQVETEGTFSQTYGYFEARIKMPAGSGEMGAFWLSGSTGVSPQLDIAEMVANSPSTVVNTVWNSAEADNHWTDVANMTDGYHTYAVDWEPDHITWYFDGQQTFQVATPSNLHQPLYLVASMTSGQAGSWEGTADPSSSSQMKIDYIRAYDSNPYTTGGALTHQSSNDSTGSSPPAPTDGASVSSSTNSSTSSDSAKSIASDNSSGSANIIDVATGSPQISATSVADVFVFDGSNHQTGISDFLPGSDKLDFEMTAQDFSNVSIDTSSRGWAVINFGWNRIVLSGVTPSQVSQGDFLFNTEQQ
jgi:beta-glucanase (GH16 family)